MKPRPNVKNYHNSSETPKHRPPQNSSLGNNTNNHNNNNNTSNVFDLTKSLGLNLIDDMPNLPAAIANLPNQEEIVKCLQALYGKNSAEILQKLPALSDWPLQSSSSTSPPDYSRVVGANNAVGNLGSGVGVVTSGGISLSSNAHAHANANNNNNNISNISNNNNNPGQSKQQDLQQQFNNSQQHSQHQSSANINHFRSHMPQHLSQQKSVLSFHHQNDLVANRNSNSSRLNLQHHINSAGTSSSSFASLNAAHASSNSSNNNNNVNNASNATSTSICSSSDATNLSTLASNIGTRNSLTASSVASHGISNIMDPLGSMDNMLYAEGSLQMGKDVLSSSHNQQSLIRHQQLQKLLKATGSQHRSPSMSTHRNEPQTQRNLTGNISQPTMSSSVSTISPPQAAFSSVPKSLLNLAACSSSSSSNASSSTSSLNSASQFSSMVSQLNLRSARHQQQSMNNTGNNNGIQANLASSTSKSSLVRTNSIGNNSNSNINSNNDTYYHKGTNEHNSANVFQQLAKATTSLSSSSPTLLNSSNGSTMLPNRMNMKTNFPLSLLSDDQSLSRTATSSSSSINAISTRSSSNSHNSSGSNHKISSHQSQVKKVSSSTSSQDAILANLQARVGVSIGENQQLISNKQQSTSNINISDSNSFAAHTTNTGSSSISPKQSRQEYANSADRLNEIESALRSVGARNDLSLLYPPMLLASNSQKRINALAAGLKCDGEDSELFTEEVKKVVLEECNIIYECKDCNNLFRSLANLVKHKRMFCSSENSHKEHNSLELNKRSYINTILPIDSVSPSTISHTPTNVTLIGDNNHQHLQSSVVDSHNVVANNEDNNEVYNKSDETEFFSTMCNTSKNNHNEMITQKSSVGTIGGVRRILRNQERKNHQERDNLRSTNGSKLATAITAGRVQTSLSKLLQSQPKNRLPITRDSALMGALNMTPGVPSVVNISSSTSTSSLSAASSKMIPQSSALENDRANSNLPSSSGNSTTNLMHRTDQLVKNSSLAKTLLKETAKISTNQLRQSVIELSKAEGINLNSVGATSSNKRVGTPKRKLLEDCIKKVKKFLNENEADGDQSNPNDSSSSISSIHYMQEQQMLNKLSNIQETPTSNEVSKMHGNSSNSENDSDMLTIDLGEPKRRFPMKKSKRKITTANQSSSISQPLSSAKQNSSSALLKALTRPVDAKNSSSHIISSIATIETTNDTTVKGINDETIKTGLKEDTKKGDISEQHVTTPSPPSPLFDRYTCDICDKDQENLSALMDHTLEVHDKETMVYPCIFCSFSFIMLENVCRHILDIHKKPKTQVLRLKEVVRIRSFLSNDFHGCSDYPLTLITKGSPANAPEKAETTQETTRPVADVKYMAEKVDSGDSKEERESVESSISPRKADGYMRTRGMKRVDCNQVMISEITSNELSESKAKKIKSSDNQFSPQTSEEHDEVGRSIASSEYNPPQHDEVCKDTEIAGIGVEDNGKIITKIDITTEKSTSIDEQDVKDSRKISSLSEKSSDEADEDVKAKADEACELRPQIVETRDEINPEIIGPVIDIDQDRSNEEEQMGDDGDASAHSDSDSSEDSDSSSSDSSSSSSSSGSDSSSSDSSSGSSSSSSGSSSSSSSSSSSNVSNATKSNNHSPNDNWSSQQLPSRIEEKHRSASSTVRETSMAHQTEMSSKNSPKKLNSLTSVDSSRTRRSDVEDGRSPQPLTNDEDDDDDSDEDGEGDGEDEDELDGSGADIIYGNRDGTSPEKEASNLLLGSKINTISPKSLTSSSASSVGQTGASGSGGSGGIMKLKIQLKTRPDEKSKVYEIV